MKKSLQAPGHGLRGTPHRNSGTCRFAKYAVLIYLVFGACCQAAYGSDPLFNRTGYGSYGLVTRTQGASKRVVFQPVDGAFNEGFEISYYDFGGQVICKGKIQSIYKDEIYSNAEDCDRFENIGPGMGVAFNGDSSEMLEVYKNKGKVEGALIDREWNRFPGIPKDLGEDQYEKMVLKSSVPVLVEFYATWCPYCQETVPVLGEIAKELEGQVRVATFDREKNPKLYSEMKVEGVPAFFLVRSGKVIGDWTGAIRDKPDVMKYIKSKLGIK